MPEFPQEFRRQLIPNGQRRAPWHDYRDRAIYMITLNAAPGVPPFSTLTGIPGSHDFAPRAVRTPLGEIIHKAISRLATVFPAVSILRRVIMPEHLHFVIFIKKRTDTHLGSIIRALKQDVRTGYAALTGSDPELTPTLFENGYHDRILMKNGQLKRMLDYVSNNPARRMLRMANPGFFRRFMLTDTEGNRYEAYGNPALLVDPDIEPVKVSSKYTPDELRRRKICWLHTVGNGGVLASPFVSAAEKRVRDWAADNGGRLINLEENGFGPRFAPKGRFHTLCAEGRLLLIAPTEHQTTKTRRDKAFWESLNSLAVRVSEGRLSPL